jgi:hypothetical protein
VSFCDIGEALDASGRSLLLDMVRQRIETLNSVFLSRFMQVLRGMRLSQQQRLPSDGSDDVGGDAMDGGKGSCCAM